MLPLHWFYRKPFGHGTEAMKVVGFSGGACDVQKLAFRPIGYLAVGPLVPDALHAFIRTTRATPENDLAQARKRLKEITS